MLFNEIQKLSSNWHSCLKSCMNIQKMEDARGKVRLRLVLIEKELDNLEELFLDYPAFTTLKAEYLKETVEGLNLSIYDFEYMERPEDIKWAIDVLERSMETL